METSTLLYSLLLAISGVVAGWLLQVLTSEIKERRDVRRSVSMAAAACLGRLKKMQMAKKKGDTPIFDGEKQHLGPDSDRFLQALSRRRKIEQSEMKIYEKLCSLLLGYVKEELIDAHMVDLVGEIQKLIIYSS